MRFFYLMLLLPLLPLRAAQETTVEAATVHYDGEQIHLNGGVKVTHAMGKVKAERAILKKDPTGKSKIDFPFLELCQNVEATFSNNGVLCCEKVSCDYLTMKSTFSGTKELHYKDGRGEIFAKGAVVEYQETPAGIEPVKIILSGNVKLLHKEGAVQYALADSVEYFPKEEIVFLNAKENERVLFFDQTNGLQLSAAQVKAKRTGENGKESIQGVGDVCFVFKEEELNKLKNHFTWN